MVHIFGTAPNILFTVYEAVLVIYMLANAESISHSNTCENLILAAAWFQLFFVLGFCGILIAYLGFNKLHLFAFLFDDLMLIITAFLHLAVGLSYHAYFTAFCVVEVIHAVGVGVYFALAFFKQFIIAANAEKSQELNAIVKSYGWMQQQMSGMAATIQMLMNINAELSS